MRVELKEMHLRNFKGVLDKTYTFSHNTIVRGTNGTGKTTLNDAFMFCLFGKDSKGNTNFGYKRRDSECNVVHNLEYSVEVVLIVDGVEKHFERTMTEKWTKPRGGKEKVLSGHEGSYYLNRVNVTQKDFNAAVATLASDEVLRMMTDVSYFMSLKDDIKKRMLLKMAYGTYSSDEADKMATEEMLAVEPQFAAFVESLSGRKIEDYNKEIAEQVKRIKTELEEIPIKISSKKETVPPAEDWDALQTIIDEHREQLAEVEKQMADENARQAGMTAEVNRLKSLLSTKQLEMTQAENNVRMSVSKRESDVKSHLYQLKSELTALSVENAKTADKLCASTTRKTELEQQLQSMREQYKAIKNGTANYSEDELQCPTCHRPYDLDKLTEHKLAENKAEGQALRVKYEAACDEVTLLGKRAEEQGLRISELNGQIADINFVPTDVAALIANDTTCNAIKQEIALIQEQISHTPQSMTDNVLLTYRQEINSKIQLYTSKLAVREVISRVEKQVADLEKQQRALNSRLADLERAQDTAKEFQKAKDRQLLQKVNSLFHLVRWDFVSEQLNGGDRISCNCYVEGMPYGERNRAGQVNAGLDIINAISRTENVSLPIIIDNAESVVEYIPTEAQKILLVVDANCNELTFDMK